MWEWSKPPLKSSAQYQSLRKNYPDIAPLATPVSPPRPVIVAPQDIPSPQQMQDILAAEIARLGLHNFELKPYSYQPKTWAESSQCFAEYTKLRQTFLKLISYSHLEECRQMGLTEEDIEQLRLRRSPENYNTHIKIPFDFGGELDLDNLCLVKTHPVHDQIHSLIELQIGNKFFKQHKIIYIPWIKGSFYYA